MEEAAARPVRVTLQYSDDCPHWRIAYDRLRQVLREDGLIDVEPLLELVVTPDDAERLRFVGSSTILIKHGSENVVPARPLVHDEQP
jgi:hypothetical protein